MEDMFPPTKVVKRYVSNDNGIKKRYVSYYNVMYKKYLKFGNKINNN